MQTCARRNYHGRFRNPLDSFDMRHPQINQSIRLSILPLPQIVQIHRNRIQEPSILRTSLLPSVTQWRHQTKILSLQHLIDFCQIISDCMPHHHRLINFLGAAIFIMPHNRLCLICYLDYDPCILPLSHCPTLIQFPFREYNPIKLMGSQLIKKLSKPLCTRIHSNTS